jgi:hypothetical protein
VVDLVKNDIPIVTGIYNAQLTITSSGLVKAGSNVHFIAGESILLNGGFEVEFGSEFLAMIAPCSPPENGNNQGGGGLLKKIFKKNKKKGGGLQ